MEFLGRFLRGATSAGRLPGFAGAAGWLNSDPLADADLRGKVVLVDFWTYTCINWLRTLSHVRAWSERYGEHGLVVVGVHTPEFPFERDDANVRWAARELGVSYPIALDPDYSVWSAFANRYWPAVYIADAEGRIRHHQFGEGGYEECERVIQRLLADAGRAGVPEDLVAPAGDGLEAQADWENLRSPETYLNEPPTGVAAGSVAAQRVVSERRLGCESRASVLNEAGGRDRLPLPRSRRPPRHGTSCARCRQCRFGCSLRVSLRAKTTALTLTGRGRGRRLSSGSTNWCASAGRSPTARSRSPSSPRASRHTSSHSARRRRST